MGSWWEFWSRWGVTQSCYRLLFILPTWWQYKMRQDIFLPILPVIDIFRKSLCVCFQNLLYFVNYSHGIHQCLFSLLCGTFMEIKKSEHSSERIVLYSNRYKHFSKCWSYFLRWKALLLYSKITDKVCIFKNQFWAQSWPFFACLWVSLT